jgi:hypothetical protein
VTLASSVYSPERADSQREEREASLKGILPIAKSIASGMLEKGEFQHQYINTFEKKFEVNRASRHTWGKKWDLPGHGDSYFDCGSWRSKGCLNVLEHNQQGICEDMVGKAFVRRYRRTCMRASCPKCYESWAGREAGKIEYRLRASPKKRRPIHLVVSPPEGVEYRLNYRDFRRRAYVISRKSGFFGGSCIFHPFRENESTKEWYFSPHFHMIGFGWIEHTKEGYEEHGWVVKNVGLRKTVSGTALYQLSHAGVHERYHTITWFGSLSYNKLRVSPLPQKEECCPICGNKLRQLWYFGSDDLPEKEGDYWLPSDDWVYKPRRFEGE